MKYFLASLLFCTALQAGAEAIPEPPGGVSLGSIEVWTDDWSSLEAELDPVQICLEIRDSYNALNVTRGYWAKLEVDTPVGHKFRQTESGATERKLSCRLRVKKFSITPDGEAS